MALILIDISNLLYRAFYTLPPDRFKTSEGLATNAVYGVSTMITKIINTMKKEYKDIHIVCCFDSNTCNASRIAIDPEYKKNRPKAPQELGHQFNLVREMIKSMNLEIMDIPNMEADDIIASLVHKYNSKYTETIICSPDKDYSQLLHYDNVKQYNAKKEIFITGNDICTMYGIPPIHFTMYQALVGDKCDNIPGCPGIGPKNAVAIINHYMGNINKLIADESVPKNLQKKVDIVKQHIELYNKSLQLVTLINNTELTLNTIYVPNIYTEDFKTFCEKYEFTSYLTKKKSLFK